MALARALPDDHRGAGGGGDGGEERVDSANTGVTEPSTLFLIPVHVDDRVIDIECYQRLFFAIYFDIIILTNSS